MVCGLSQSCLRSWKWQPWQCECVIATIFCDESMRCHLFWSWLSIRVWLKGVCLSLFQKYYFLYFFSLFTERDLGDRDCANRLRGAVLDEAFLRLARACLNAKIAKVLVSCAELRAVMDKKKKWYFGKNLKFHLTLSRSSKSVWVLQVKNFHRIENFRCAKTKERKSP